MQKEQNSQLEQVSCGLMMLSVMDQRRILEIAQWTKSAMKTATGMKSLGSAVTQIVLETLRA